MAKFKILIVEDDRALTDILTYNLKQAKYEVLVARDGVEGLAQARSQSPDLVVLDIMLPLLDGLEVCRRLRKEPSTQKLLILMLTSKAEEADQLLGFSLGADDYVTKPFSVKVLLERVKALERRFRSASESADIIESQGVTVDRIAHQASLEGRLLPLTRSEFYLLYTLIRQPGRAYSRGELIDAALGDDALVLERTIDVHIRALRRKLGEKAHLVETVRGVGYRFHDPSQPAD